MQADPRRPPVLVVDDHPIVREGLALFLATDPEFGDCLCASNAEEAMTLAELHGPALAVIDISLQDSSGLELIRQLRRRRSDLRILVLSLHDEGVFAERALRAGANGYLMKHEATAKILTALRAVRDQGSYLSAAMQARLGRTAGNTDAGGPLAGISEREFEVLHLLGMGLSTREIGSKLNRSIKTVETHRARLKTKLKLESSDDLIRFATRWLDESPGRA